MIIQLKQDIQEADKLFMEQVLNQLKIEFYPVQTQKGTYLICTPKQEFDIRKIGHLKGINDVHRVSGNHKMVSHKWKVDRTVLDLGDGVVIGDGNLSMMAGPCSIESEEQIDKVVEALKANGVRIMRGGVYKPRTSPYSFRGLGMVGLKMFYKACNKNGIKIITEIMESSQIEDMLPYVDIFQVGARNAQNFNLLEALGEIDKPVLLKRGISGTIDELLYSAEYVFKNGNEKIILCERGIRTFESAYRNTLDLNAVPILKEKSHLPVVVDPSHGIGLRQHVAQMALAGAVVGADGLLVEIHETPEKAATDGQQTLDFKEFERLMTKLNQLKEIIK
ncbi:3-deoxy-7-phosphoheptulonate synthase [Putridiphycobacter roseus]|uniref:3-deoxy-7-phosphoheptulonate synthase n=1 Tax=Putridiphycobacter roseus TaxID=2219161 RepID=A0A2W1NC19_9FLAO|nr:3-deoxy-7-phosphoheptulonate synthase [Putridiphycobacter roseus]PZE15656.1 3-deoxy-7-phosphoheptulonate synthase [Putridiphycobacter roseus]